jgi:alkylation response protein AidB-like acyl-CoA dehydrogenase
MDFTLSNEQVLLKDTARALLTKECPISLVRAHIDDPSAAGPLWAHLRDWVALADGPLVDTCLFLEECGAALAPGPFFPTLLARMLLPDVTSPATVAVAGADGVWRPNADPTKTFVLEADRADAAVIVDVDGIACVDPDPKERIALIDSTRRCFTMDAPAGARRAADVDGWLQRATVALAADMVGTARALLERSIAYAKERVQFDAPIGSFQAIQHKLADMAVELERAVAAVYYAAMTIDADDPDRHRAAHVAKAAAGAAATRAAKDGIQIHGGIGYTWEHDLHLFIRRAYVSEHLLGTRGWHHDQLAKLLFAPAVP